VTPKEYEDILREIGVKKRHLNRSFEKHKGVSIMHKVIGVSVFSYISVALPISILGLLGLFGFLLVV